MHQQTGSPALFLGDPHSIPAGYVYTAANLPSDDPRAGQTLASSHSFAPFAVSLLEYYIAAVGGIVAPSVALMAAGY